MRQYFKISGIGGYLPKTVISAEELDERFGYKQGTSLNHGGVKKRHLCDSPETLHSMAKQAIDQAMRGAKVDWKDVDLLIDASTSRMQPIPFGGSLLKRLYGEEADGIPTFNIDSTCLSFVVALNVANSLLASGSHQKIIIASSESALPAANRQEKGSACILGDGAAAVVLEKTDPRATFDFVHQTFSQYSEYCQVIGGTHRLPPFAYKPEIHAKYLFQMDGRNIFRVAKKHLATIIEMLVAREVFDFDKAQVIPHPGSPSSVKLVRKLLRFPEQRFHCQMEEFGNLVAAGIPYSLFQSLSEGRVKKGDQILLLGTSAGYSQAGLVFEL